MKTTSLLLFYLIAFIQISAANLWVDGFTGKAGNDLDPLSDGHEKTVAAVYDDDLNLYVLGSFESQEIDVGNQTLTNNGTTDVFLIKYDSIGNVVWAISCGGQSIDQPTSMAIDQNDDLYIGGYFLSQSLNIGGITLNTNGGKDIFIAKLDNDGNVDWAKNFGSNLDESCYGIDVDSNHIYIAGEFSSNSVVFGGTTLDLQTPSVNLLVVKLNKSGDPVWAQTAGVNDPSGGEVHGSAIAVDNNGNVGVGISFGNSITEKFGYIYWGNDTLWNKNFEEWQGVRYYKESACMIKFDGNGNYIGGFSDSSYNKVTAMAVDSMNNFYMGMQTVAYIIIGSAYSDCALLKIDTAINGQWKKEYKSWRGVNKVTHISTNEEGVLVSGNYAADTLKLDTDSLVSRIYKGRYYDDIFIISYTIPGIENWARHIGAGLTDLSSAVYKIPGKEELFITGHFESHMLGFSSDTIENNAMVDSFHVHVSPDWHWRFSKTFIARHHKDSIFITPPPNGIPNTPPSQVMIFPNPSSDRIMVIGKQMQYLEIYNNIGQLVIHEKVYDPFSQILDLSDQPKGVYHLRVKMENGIASRKIIIQ